eukprot:TRINITY_DN6866_c0_g1_i11.p2 TRINITY_DN6866_c0_g1~~TRINITY_DN6866_c0_g1_i11.p2  ORF type:complete len:413 (-),score=66.70 TRINITY_DN6866_c0_g1_i11:11-1189(-)
MTRIAKRTTLVLPVLTICSTALAQPGASCLDQRFRPNFEPRSLEFGVDVATSDEHFLVVDRFSEGIIYTYRRDAGSGEWAFNQAVAGGSGGDVVLDGDRFITGDVRVERFGGARIYEFTGSQWVETGVIESANDPRRTEWGEHVAIHEGRAVVGNGGEAVIVAEESMTGWEQVDFLTSPDSPARRSDFGDALAMDERFLFIGAPGEDLTGNQNGAIYVYEWGPDGRPVLMQKLVPEPADVGPRLGTSLALEGDTLVAGARSLDTPDYDNIGAAYVFELIDGQWTNLQELLPDPRSSGAEFGWDVTLDGDTIAVGALSQSIAGAGGVGAAHVFRKGPAGEWVHARAVAGNRRRQVEKETRKNKLQRNKSKRYGKRKVKKLKVERTETEQKSKT